jgi:hypothetical protein
LRVLNLLLLPLLLTALVSAPRPGVSQPVPLPSADSARTQVIYVARRGWHIDIGFSADDLQAPLKSLARKFPDVRYLFFGFGDRRYLLAKNHSAPVLLAALWPGRAMVLATGLSSPPEAAFGATHVIALKVTLQQSQSAQAYIWKSLDNAIEPYGRGPYEGSLYFTAASKYSAIHTCNTWVAEALKAGALPIHSAGVIFAGQLWGQLRRLAQQGGLEPS